MLLGFSGSCIAWCERRDLNRRRDTWCEHRKLNRRPSSFLDWILCVWVGWCERPDLNRWVVCSRQRNLGKVRSRREYYPYTDERRALAAILLLLACGLMVPHAWSQVDPTPPQGGVPPAQYVESSQASWDAPSSPSTLLTLPCTRYL
jgi:hypothetical protein